MGAVRKLFKGGALKMERNGLTLMGYLGDGSDGRFDGRVNKVLPEESWYSRAISRRGTL